MTPQDLAALGLDWLLEASVLGQLEPGDLGDLLAAVEWWDYDPGEVLIEEGVGPRGVDLIVAGQATVMASAPGGTFEHVARVSPGHLVGERSILRGETTIARVVAASPMRTLHVPQERFQALLERSEALRRYVTDLVALRERSGLVMDLLRQNPLLRSLGRDDLEWLLQSGTLLRYEPGALVVRAGERTTDVFVVVKGKVAVYAPAPEGGERQRLAVYEPGALLGHVAVLMDVPRTADVVTAKRCELLKIRARAFMEIINRNARVQRQLYQHVAGLELHTDEAREVGRGMTVVTVWSAHQGLGTTTLAYGVAAVLSASGPVTLVDLEGARSAQRLGFEVRREEVGGVSVGSPATPPSWRMGVCWPEEVATVPALIAALRERQRDEGYVVIACVGAAPPDPAMRAASQATILVRRSSDPSSRQETARKGFWVEAVRLQEGVELPFTTSVNTVRIPEDRGSEGFWRTGDLARLTDQGAATGRVCQRLVRVLQGRTVGVALGGGGALGFAHIGLLRALHEADVPVDYLAGVSFGSVVGALYASGGLALLDELIRQRRRFQAYAGLALLSLGPLTAWVAEVTGGRTLGGTEVPFFPVALDLWTGRELVLTRGTVAEGMRASSSFPGIFPPFRKGVHHLVDGGIINNVPASVVWDAGASFILASNVIPPQPVGRGPTLGEGPWSRLKASTVGRFDDLVRSMFILMSQTGLDRASLADYVFDLDLEGYNIYDFHRGDVIYEAGLRQARGELPEILYAREHDRSIRVPPRASA